MKKYNQMIRVILCGSAFVFICLILVSCSKKKPVASSVSKPPSSFENQLFLEITPLSDGSAYANSLDSGLWYLRGSKAVKVTILTNASQKLPEFSEITPVLDGGAYATSWESGMWYLHAERAEKVAEAASIADSSTPIKVLSNAFYALYVYEHKKRKEAEYRADNPAEFTGPPETPDDSDY